MLGRWKAVALIGALIVSARGGCAQAHHWEALYAFGDSYTDSGAGYVDGNGPTAVVYLASMLNIQFTYAGDPQSAGKSLNFAISDAHTGGSDGYRIRPASATCGSDEAWFGRGMQNQVADFVQRVKGGAIKFNPETTLFFIAGGLNDQAVRTARSISNLENEVQTLYASGGRYFLIALLPTTIPPFREVGLRLNPALAQVPRELGSSIPGIHIALSEWGKYFDGVLENPAPYGITNTTDQCAGRAILGEDPTSCATPDRYFYYHEGHPSTAVQRIVAREMERDLGKLFP